MRALGWMRTGAGARGSRPVGVAVAVAGLLTAAVATFAAWNIGAAPGAGAVSKASSIPAPGQPATAAVGDRAVALSWNAVTLPSGGAVSGYTVNASPAGGGSPRAGGGTCAGTVTATTCTDDTLPDGTWEWRVAAVFGPWTSLPSPASTPVAIPADACAASANEIAAENCKPGDPASEWDISGAGDPSIQGFATDISVNQGQTISFKIDTTSTDYRIDLYRLGYYGGLGARKVATIGTAATIETAQPACLVIDGTTNDNLVDCGNWTVSASWAVPPDAVSGIYIAKPTRADNGGASHIAFIVRDDDGGSDVLFQTSDTTWQAYNRYGGYSLYDGPGHAHKVSYNRPFTTRDAPTEDWLFNAEYPMVRWLERNGYDVSYFTDVD
ncbi:MAG: N,N-dimethylformamidase beta subunit family domain-containing protein, partial [Mycobacterium sp.]